MKIATKNNKTTAQILLRWCYQVGCVVIAKTLNPTRMIENMSIFDFELDQGMIVYV